MHTRMPSCLVDILELVLRSARHLKLGLYDEQLRPVGAFVAVHGLGSYLRLARQHSCNTQAGGQCEGGQVAVGTKVREVARVTQQLVHEARMVLRRRMALKCYARGCTLGNADEHGY